MNFIGREEEIKKLQSNIELNKFNFTLIYGRRRIGKSELVKHVINKCGYKFIYYECKQVNEINNVNSLCEIVSDSLSLPKLGYTDIESLLKYIFQLSKNEKIVLVLDEYPFLKMSIKGMDSILQSLIDSYKDKSLLSIIILGSYVEVMKGLLKYSSPLFGRVNLTIELKQMDYYESSLFYPNYSEEDKVRIYSIFGGIPYYNSLIDDTKTVKENIIDLIASPGSILENEVIYYLSSEISKIANANEVFEALSKGFTKFSDILSQSYVSSSPALVDVLEKLIKMEVVEKVAPINDSQNKKKTKYRICDNFSLFYYRYIFRNSSKLKIMDPEIFYKKYIEKDLEEYFIPHQFETICKQYLVRLNKKGKISPVIEKIGKYYYDNPKEHINGEFDVVTEDENGYIFYEVKFTNRPVTDSLIEEEIQQVTATGLKCYKYVFISRSGFSCAQRDDVKLIKLKELFD